jgi:hypothetical protein
MCHVAPKRRYRCTNPHCCTSPKTIIFTGVIARTSDLTKQIVLMSLCEVNKTNSIATYKHNTVLRRFFETIVAVYKQQVLTVLRVFSFRNPAYNAHAPSYNAIYRTYHIFFTLTHKRRDFRRKKKLLNTKCLF